MSLRSYATAAIAIIPFFIVTFFGLSIAESATNETDKEIINAGLAEDIKTLGEMLGVDLSKKSPPKFFVLPENQFDAIIAEAVKEGKMINGEYVGYFNCESNELLISHLYVEGAVAAKIDSQKYLRMVRFHELYHWAMCQTKGRYRFRLNSDSSQPVMPELWFLEEVRAEMFERRYLVEKLGTIVPVAQDSIVPPPPRIAKKNLPTDPLLDQMLVSWEPADEFLVLSDTQDGTPIFIYVFRSVAIMGNDEFFFNLVSHRGKYVEISIFKNRVYYRSWSDRGYAGDPGSDKFPANPTYQGEWVRIK